MEEKKYSMIDNLSGLCAGVAVNRFVHLKLGMVYACSGGITRLGCQILEMYCGIKVGVAVREETNKIRTNLLKMKEKEIL